MSDVVYRDVTLTAFYASQIVSMNARLGSQSFLRQAPFLAQTADVSGQFKTGFVNAFWAVGHEPTVLAPVYKGLPTMSVI